MPSKKHVLKAYLSEEEHNHIAAQAKQAGLSLSGYARRVCLNYQVRGLDKQRFILELAHTRADLGRLGGLFKLSLTQPGNSNGIELRRLLRNIDALQEEISRLIKQQ